MKYDPTTKGSEEKLITGFEGLAQISTLGDVLAAAHASEVLLYRGKNLDPIARIALPGPPKGVALAGDPASLDTIIVYSTVDGVLFRGDQQVAPVGRGWIAAVEDAVLVGNGRQPLVLYRNGGRAEVSMPMNALVNRVAPGDKSEVLVINDYDGLVYSLDLAEMRVSSIPLPLGVSGSSGVGYDALMGRFYVSEGRDISVYERDEDFISYSFNFGDDEIVYPGAMAVLDDGRLAVADVAWPGAVKVFRPEGVES